MANTKNKESLAYKNKLAYIKAQNKKNFRFYIMFNPNTEMDMIEWIKKQRKAPYIKRLIREDMEKQKGKENNEN